MLSPARDGRAWLRKRMITRAVPDGEVWRVDPGFRRDDGFGGPQAFAGITTLVDLGLSPDDALVGLRLSPGSRGGPIGSAA